MTAEQKKRHHPGGAAHELLVCSFCPVVDGTYNGGKSCLGVLENLLTEAENFTVKNVL